MWAATLNFDPLRRWVWASGPSSPARQTTPTAAKVTQASFHPTPPSPSTWSSSAWRPEGPLQGLPLLPPPLPHSSSHWPGWGANIDPSIMSAVQVTAGSLLFLMLNFCSFCFIFQVDSWFWNMEDLLLLITADVSSLQFTSSTATLVSTQMLLFDYHGFRSLFCSLTLNVKKKWFDWSLENCVHGRKLKTRDVWHRTFSSLSSSVTIFFLFCVSHLHGKKKEKRKAHDWPVN